MAKQIINIGTTANDGTGDTLRESQRKANDNFTELYDAEVVKGSGTVNYLPKFTPDGKTLGNSFIFENNGNIGVGTTIPAGKLDVSKGLGSQTAGDLVVDCDSNTVYIGKLDSVSGNTNFVFRDRIGGIKSRWNNANFGSLYFGNMGGNHGVKIQTAGIAPSLNAVTNGLLEVDGTGRSDGNAAIFLNGNVGIGTALPSEKLHVSGNIIASPATNPDHVVPLSQVEGMIGNNRVDDVWNGAEDLDWQDGVHVVEVQGATVLSDINLPQGDKTWVKEILAFGDFPIDIPSYWTPKPSSDTYDGTVLNHFVISCMNGNTGEEIVIYSIENLS